MYELTEEQRMVQQAIRKIVSKEVEPKIGETDKIGDFPFDVAKMLIDHGFHLLPLPEEYGGYDSVLMNCLGIEELSGKTARKPVKLNAQQRELISKMQLKMPKMIM
ncbi:MAG: acyl-CoA dehydrogenase family protein [Syntrophales bacterium]|nr:acyl-CoA dehydrogenase family protein [Syntrophales bacterium]